MKESRMRAGWVGAHIDGGWGGVHGAVYPALPETDLVAVCNKHPEMAKAAAEKYGAQHVMIDYHEMVRIKELDLVIVTPVAMHHDVGMAALEAGKHVISEWPLALTSQLAQEMYDLAKAKNLGTAVVLQARCAPAVMYLHDLIAQGYIGRPLTVNMTYHRDTALRPKDSVTRRMIRKGVNNSALDVASGHSLHALLYCFGELESVCADVDTVIKEGTLADTGERVQVDAEDYVAFIGRFRSGAKVTVQVSWLANPPLGWQVSAYGTEGCITLTRNLGGDADIRFVGLTVRGAKGLSPDTMGDSGNPLKQLPIPARYNWTPEFEPNVAAFPVAQLVRRAVHDFAAGKEARPNFLDAARMHRLLETLVESSETRSWIKLPPDGPGSD